VTPATASSATTAFLAFKPIKLKSKRAWPYCHRAYRIPMNLVVPASPVPWFLLEVSARTRSCCVRLLVFSVADSEAAVGRVHRAGSDLAAGLPVTNVRSPSVTPCPRAAGRLPAASGGNGQVRPNPTTPFARGTVGSRLLTEIFPGQPELPDLPSPLQVRAASVRRPDARSILQLPAPNPFDGEPRRRQEWMKGRGRRWFLRNGSPVSGSG
jgi:hypothetical protein